METDGGMNSEQTQAAARKQLYGYFRQMLRVLPVESALSLVHPELPQAGLHRGVTLPYEETATEVVTEFFDISYWITGIAPDVADEYFDLIVRSWSRDGWPTRTDRTVRPRAAYTRTPDRYGLSVRESVNGYLSLSGSTPPFAPGTPEGPPPPQRIERTETRSSRTGPWARD